VVYRNNRGREVFASEAAGERRVLCREQTPVPPVARCEIHWWGETYPLAPFLKIKGSEGFAPDTGGEIPRCKKEPPNEKFGGSF